MVFVLLHSNTHFCPAGSAGSAATGTYVPQQKAAAHVVPGADPAAPPAAKPPRQAKRQAPVVVPEVDKAEPFVPPPRPKPRVGRRCPAAMTSVPVLQSSHFCPPARPLCRHWEVVCLCCSWLPPTLCTTQQPCQRALWPCCPLAQPTAQSLLQAEEAADPRQQQQEAQDEAARRKQRATERREKDRLKRQAKAATFKAKQAAELVAQVGAEEAAWFLLVCGSGSGLHSQDTSGKSRCLVQGLACSRACPPEKATYPQV